MPFVLDPAPTFQAPVRFRAPGPDGQPVTHEFTATFRLLDDDESSALVAQAQAEKWTDRILAARLIVGWGDDITDAQGQPLPFNDANLQAVLRRRNCPAGVLAAYQAALENAALGN